MDTGITQNIKVDKTIQYDITRCPKCNGKHIHKVNTIQKIVVDILEPQPVTAIRHVILTYSDDQKFWTTCRCIRFIYTSISKANRVTRQYLDIATFISCTVSQY